MNRVAISYTELVTLRNNIAVFNESSVYNEYRINLDVILRFISKYNNHTSGTLFLPLDSIPEEKVIRQAVVYIIKFQKAHKNFANIITQRDDMLDIHVWRSHYLEIVRSAETISFKILKDVI